MTRCKYIIGFRKKRKIAQKVYFKMKDKYMVIKMTKKGFSNIRKLMEALYFFIGCNTCTSSSKINYFLCLTNLNRFGLDYGIEIYLGTEFDGFNWLNQPSNTTIDRVMGWSIMFTFRQTSIIEVDRDFGKLNVLATFENDPKITVLRALLFVLLFVCLFVSAMPPVHLPVVWWR